MLPALLRSSNNSLLIVDIGDKVLLNLLEYNLCKETSVCLRNFVITFSN